MQFSTTMGRIFASEGVKNTELKLSQFSRNVEHYQYEENSSKNRQGGWAQMRIEKKSVPMYANPEAGDRCHVKILDLYFNRLSEEAKKNIFYTRPVPTLPKNPYDPWYCAVPYGKNKLSSMFKEMCIEAGIGHKTNHSLRATGASELFKEGVPEKNWSQVPGSSSNL